MYVLFIPEFFFFFVSLIFVFWGLLYYSNNNASIIISHTLNIIFLYVFVIIILMYIYILNYAANFTFFDNNYVSDYYSVFLKIIFLFFLLFFHLFSYVYFLFEKIYFVEYILFLFFFSIASFSLPSTNNFILLYMLIELQSLSLYTLLALKRYNNFSIEASLKFFLIGALSSGLMLFGISFIYAQFGTLNFFDLKMFFLKWLNFEQNLILIFAFFFFFFGVLFKLGLAPFNIWVPDVYEGMPTAILLIFSTLPKLSIFFFLIKFFMFFLFELAHVWFLIFFFSGIASVFFGTFGALRQVSIKRFYAYSAIVNIGYLSVTLSNGDFFSFVNLLMFFFVYILTSLLLILTILYLRKSRNLAKLRLLSDYVFYLKFNFFFSFLVLVCFFSFAGVPPLAGFFVKFFLFFSFFKVYFLSNFFFYFFLFLTIVSTFYYIRCIQYVFFNMSYNNKELFLKNSFFQAIFLINLAFFFIFFIFFYQIFESLTIFVLFSIFF